MQLSPGSIFMQEALAVRDGFAGELSQGSQPGNRQFCGHPNCTDMRVLAIKVSAMTDAVSNQSRGMG